MASEDVFGTLYARGERMRAGIAKAIGETGVEAVVAGLGSEWCVYFRAELPTNFREAMQSDGERYARYHASLLAQGILEPAFPTGDRRLNAATSEEDVDRTLECVHVALAAAAS
ncbi:hypothetical protein [Saccharopolyspora sp. NPDC002376]